MKLMLKVNGRARQVDADGDTPLLWILRDELGMTGTKFGCGVAQCGSCTVHVDGAAVRSCVMPLQALKGKQITTIEAWIEHQVPQCGYCQSGMLMAAAALLKHTPKPTDAQIDQAMTNICRCGTYPRVRAAIHSAARKAGVK